MYEPIKDYREFDIIFNSLYSKQVLQPSTHVGWLLQVDIKSLGHRIWSYGETHFKWSIYEGGDSWRSLKHMERIMRNLKCILYLGEMFIKATRESIYIRYGLKIPVGKKKKSCIYHGKDNKTL